MIPLRVLCRCRAVIVACVLGPLLLTRFASEAFAQEPPYFVTYNDYLEERGEFGVSLFSTVGSSSGDVPSYVAPWIELEYGVMSGWTSELYFEGVTIHGDGSTFTGWRWENRFRLLKGDHAIKPLFYVEYEHLNEASRIQKEIAGTGPLPSEPLSVLTDQRAHELDGRLILSSHIGSWDLSENVIVEKNFSASEGIEFGYAVGAFRPLGNVPNTNCRFCRDRFAAGIEAYGGLGSTQNASLTDTRQYIAPVFAWYVVGESQLKASVGFGMTANSGKYLVRFGYTVELP